jgi:hypothetical protein
MRVREKAVDDFVLLALMRRAIAENRVVIGQSRVRHRFDIRGDRIPSINCKVATLRNLGPVFS